MLWNPIQIKPSSCRLYVIFMFFFGYITLALSKSFINQNFSFCSRQAYPKTTIHDEARQCLCFFRHLPNLRQCLHCWLRYGLRRCQSIFILGLMFRWAQRSTHSQLHHPWILTQVPLRRRSPCSKKLELPQVGRVGTSHTQMLMELQSPSIY